MLRASLGAAVGALIVFAAGSAESRQPSSWSERGVFVFGELSLDFRYGWVAPSSTGGRAALEDCSTAEYFCAHSELVDVSLPKACPSTEDWRPGTRVGGETEVWGVLPAPPGHHSTEGRRWFVLGTASRPWIAYIYDPESGVLQILADLLRRHDLRALAAQGAIENGGPAGAAPEFRRHYLTTFDSFGGCR